MGAKTSSRDREPLGKKTPLIGPHESAHYVHNNIGAVQPLWAPVQPITGNKRYNRPTTAQQPHHNRDQSGGRAVHDRYNLWTNSGAVQQLQTLVVPVNQYNLSMGRYNLHVKHAISKQPQLSHTSFEFDEIKFVGKLATRANTILIEITIIRKLEKAHKKMVRTLPRIRLAKPPTPKTQ